MDNAALVRGLGRFSDLPRNPQRLVEGNRSFSNSIGERWAFDQLKHERMHAVRFFQTVDGA